MEFYATLGPSCTDLAILEAMAEAGMTGLRLNLAHADLPAVRPTLQAFFRKQQQRHRLMSFLVDLIGAKLRVGRFLTPQKLVEGEVLYLFADDVFQNEANQQPAARTLDRSEKLPTSGPRVPVPAPVFSVLEAGDRINFDDRKLLASVQIVHHKEAICQILRGGLLCAGKTLKVEGKEVPLPPITLQDTLALQFLSEIAPDAVMVPFCEEEEDVRNVRQTMAKMGLQKARIFAKIETPRGVENVENILPACDCAVIARGDLGNAYPLPEVPRLQKQLAKKCRAVHRPFLIVTELLASMETKAIPTRAEVCDIYNAVLDGAGALMLTGETAMGHYPIEAMRILVQTATTAIA